MNKLFLRGSLVATCLLANLASAAPTTQSNTNLTTANILVLADNSSLGGAAIEKHKKNVQALKSSGSYKSTTNVETPETPNNNSTGAAAIEKHEKVLNSKTPYQ